MSKQGPPGRDDRPLDSLVPGLSAPPPPADQSFLELHLPDGDEWVLSVLNDPGSPGALHHQVGHLVEASLVSALSAPRADEAAMRRDLKRLRLLLFAPIEHPAPAITAFGFGPETPAGEHWQEIYAEIAGPDRTPHSTFAAAVDPFGAALGAEILRLERALLDDTREVWGEDPGQPSARLLHLMQDLSGQTFRSDLATIDAAEALLVSSKPACIRWIPPLVFQALCDLIGVVAQRALGAEVEWAVSEPEPDGFVPPPTFRVAGTTHVPIALHLLRWCIMPLRPGEKVPPISEWMRDQFAPDEES